MSPLSRSKVVVSRQWDNPQILCEITKDGISLAINGDAFVRAVVTEVGNPTLLVTQKQLREKLDEAFQRVIDEIKRASSHIV